MRIIKDNTMVDIFTALVNCYGENDEFHTFEYCTNYGVELAGSTIDKVVIMPNDVLFYYNENTGDYDSFTAFKDEDLIGFYDGLTDAIKEEIGDNISNAFAIDESLDEYEMEERIKETLGEGYSVRNCDSWIDDGCEEDEEDEYVKGVLFEVRDKHGLCVDVKIYYGDNTFKIGCIETS